MADLLQSLLTTWPDPLQHQSEANMYGPGSSIRQTDPQHVPGGFPGAIPDAADTNLVFVDADEFLQSIPTRSEDGPSNVIRDLQPVKIGQSRSSAHSIAFHELAQEKRITAAFEYREPVPQQFSVKLTLGGQVDVEDAGLWPSKKAAKEAICERGIQVLRDMEGTVTPSPGGENWVGMLQQFYDLEDGACQRPVYTDFAVGNQFACELVIDKRASTPFGGRLVTFSNKKAAKANAARLAIEWLIEDKFMGPEGPPAKKKRKGGSSGTPVAAVGSGATVEIKRDASFAQKVNGLTAPEYRLDLRADSMYSGAAYFNNPILPRGPIGEVRNLFGKKNAKEEIAKSVLAFLKEWAKNRGVELKERE